MTAPPVPDTGQAVTGPLRPCQAPLWGRTRATCGYARQSLGLEPYTQGRSSHD